MLRRHLFAVALWCAFTLSAHAESMTTSYYGRNDGSGTHTASGSRFSANDPTIAAHKSLQFGTRLLLRNPHNGRTQCVVVRDRGPFIRGRELDVTYAAAQNLGFVSRGVVELQVQRGAC